MKRTTTNWIAVAALAAVGALNAVACPLVYTINFSGQFGLLDVSTGVFTPIGKGLENTPDGIAGKPGGPFYTVDGFTGHLLRIGLDGKVTDVGDTKTGPNAGPNGVSVIGALTDGSVYALDFSNKLFRVNTETAALTLIGALPSLPAQESEYIGNMTTSLNGDAERLYFTIEISDGPRKTGPTLYTINPTNLLFGRISVNARPIKTSGRVIGSGVVNGSLYLYSETGNIIRVDPVTGETTTVSRYDSGQEGDGPPFTGIFGSIAGIEPNAVHAPVAPVVAPTANRAHWPPRTAPLPSRTR